jgi:hypothetical protein
MPHERFYTLWALALPHIRLLALRPVQLLLRLVKSIKLRVHGVSEGVDVAVWVDFLPWVRASTAFAGFEHDEEGIEAREEGADGLVGGR